MNIELTPERIKKAAIWIAIAIGAVILIFNSTYQVREQEQAVVLTFGNAKTVSQSGLHFKIPFIQQVEKVDTTIKGISIGYNIDTGETVDDEALMITSDYNFVNVDFFLEYQVSDPGNSEVDSVLTTGKSEIQAKIKEMISTRLDEQKLGIYLVNITMQDAEPPTTEVMEAFKAVETAKQGKETAINNANKYKNEKMPEAQAKVDQIKQSAEGERQERVNEANGQVARFEQLYAEYIKYPEVTKLRMFYEAMEELLPNMEIIIDTGNGTGVQKILPLDSFANITTGGVQTGNDDNSSQ